MSITELQQLMFNSVLGEDTKGFAELKDIREQQYSEGSVLKGMEYRPDLVADYYLGNSNLAWMITSINNFVNGIEDYTLGKKLKIPSI